MKIIKKINHKKSPTNPEKSLKIRTIKILKILKNQKISTNPDEFPRIPMNLQRPRKIPVLAVLVVLVVLVVLFVLFFKMA